jgi:hypothetical protein
VTAGWLGVTPAERAEALRVALGDSKDDVRWNAALGLLSMGEVDLARNEMQRLLDLAKNTEESNLTEAWLQTLNAAFGAVVSSQDAALLAQLHQMAESHRVLKLRVQARQALTNR